MFEPSIKRDPILLLLYCSAWHMPPIFKTICKSYTDLSVRNKVLRSICGCKTKDITRGWGKLLDEPYYLYPSPKTMAIISRWMRCAGHAVCMGVMRCAKFYSEKLKGRDNLEDLLIDGGQYW